MTEIYIFFVVVLLALAAFDLTVGVANDAVNFLGAAVGAKAARWRTIMIVASIGVIAGAAMSNGMMDIARNSIFKPESFSFEQIMILFMAVMFTDIILLDIFNTLGLPTSTTVSIVFALLGAALAVSVHDLTVSDKGLEHLSEYVNGDAAIKIVVSILLSVVIAFFFGAVVQYLSRLLFSFQYQKRIKYVGAIWSGIALTAMTFFLLIKGLKHASFVSPDEYKWLQAHTWQILAVFFVVWTTLLQILVSFTKVNILKLVVLFGTFALAMAFAGNDLVNFIGVPLAGLESFTTWTAANAVAPIAASDYMMTSLADQSASPSYLLLIAGGIMVVTLWVSKKARTVTETTVKLSRQSEGAEKYRPNNFSRAVVKIARVVSNSVSLVVPDSFSAKLERNFQAPGDTGSIEASDFDLVRASVNLFVASMVIAVGTSLKLPLSTTYVGFMVAMGASLADRAWGRDSAVYRIAGVISVIGGWFITAIAAMLMAMVFAVGILYFGLYAVIFLVLMAAFLVLRSNVVHRRVEKKKAELHAAIQSTTASDTPAVQSNTLTKVVSNVATVKVIIETVIKGMQEEDTVALRGAERLANKLQEQNQNFRFSLFQYIQRLQTEDKAASKMYITVFQYEEELVQSILQLTVSCHDYVRNVHTPMDAKQAEKLAGVAHDMVTYLQRIATILETLDFSTKTFKVVLQLRDNVQDKIDALMEHQTKGIRNEKYGGRNSMMVFTMLMEFKDIATVCAKFVKIYHKDDKKAGKALIGDIEAFEDEK